MTTAARTRPRLGKLSAMSTATDEHGLTRLTRDGLRWIAGIGHARPGVPARLFPPSPETLDRLLDLKLIEPNPATPHAYRPTFAAVQLVPLIGPRET